jgi:AraC family transcriptional regulator, regulatory protein of adaptative response / DNA-3-methyladenine glycosylase II
MTHDAAALYSAVASRDPRFDGVFYVGVTSTGIYCRPICPAKTPKASNCRFFNSAEAAEKASFRPCLRCRPELAPGNAPVDASRRIATLLAYRIEEGALDNGAGMEEIAKRFGWSSRQLRRMAQKELGVSPIELALTRRLLLAKQLLTETMLPITDIAFASGFASVRRFNDAFSGRYGMPPTRLRRAANGPVVENVSPASFTLQLSYRPPFDWSGMMRFLGARTMKGVEWVQGDVYFRTARLGQHSGWIRVDHAADRRVLLVELTHSLTPVLPTVLGRLRHLFDLTARPDVIAAKLEEDPLLSDAIARNPGLRVPGAFDGFELAVRAILGQQVSVKSARTLAGRFAAAFGDEFTTPHAGLTRLSPTPERVAGASPTQLVALGILESRARSIIRLAEDVATGRLSLDAGAEPNDTIERLTALPGIGMWTAQYIAMRALRWPDAFPSGDIAVRKRLGGVTAVRAEARSRAWSPWRSYATLHLWESVT